MEIDLEHFGIHFFATYHTIARSLLAMGFRFPLLYSRTFRQRYGSFLLKYRNQLSSDLSPLLRLQV